MAVLGGWAVSYERGTPVFARERSVSHERFHAAVNQTPHFDSSAAPETEASVRGDISPQSGIKSPFLGPWCVLELAGIR